MEQLNTINLRCKELRELGRESLKGKWKTAFLAFALYVLIGTIPVFLLLSLPVLGFVGVLICILVQGALALGLSSFFLKAARGEDFHVKDMFCAFSSLSMIFKTLGLLFFQILFITLWSLLFVVPGIIAAIKYSQAFFIMVDDKTKSIRQCVKESKALMQGNKKKYFLMNLSFFGWLLLAELGFWLGTMLVMTVFGVFFGYYILSPAYITALLCLVLIIDLLSIALLIVCFAPIMSYMYATRAAFYKLLVKDDTVDGSVEEEHIDGPDTEQETSE